MRSCGSDQALIKIAALAIAKMTAAIASLSTLFILPHILSPSVAQHLKCGLWGKKSNARRCRAIDGEVLVDIDSQ